MITFFTTAKPFRGTTAIQQINCLKSLLHSVPGCEIFLFDAVEGSTEVCEQLGLSAPLPVERSAEDTPRIDSMFGEVARRAKHPISCFINCDILITPEFSEHVLRVHAELKKDYLVVGQRLNFDCDESLFTHPDWTARLKELAKRSGRIQPPQGSDQFVYPTGLFNRENMPPLLVGRAAWDNWMFYEALRRGLKLIDLSPDYLVYHQNHDYLHRRSMFVDYDTDPEAAWNRRFLPQRVRRWLVYILDRCNYEVRNGLLTPKRLTNPGTEFEKRIAGGAEAADEGALETPIALIHSCQSETMRAVIEAMRVARPKFVYVIVDATKKKEESSEQSHSYLDELETIDWPCQLRTHFATEHLGSARLVKGGIDWLFEREEQAIILQDNLNPSPDFFRFCEVLLDQYRHDSRVGTITAMSHEGDVPSSGADYYFSRYPNNQAWATWKRAWLGIDLGIEIWPQLREKGFLNKVFKGESAVLQTWTRILDETYRGRWDTCDHQWALHSWMRDLLTIRPVVSLACSIEDGRKTFPTQKAGHSQKPQLGKISFPLRAPAQVARDSQADEVIFKENYNYYQQAAPPLKKTSGPTTSKPWKKPSLFETLLQLPRIHHIRKTHLALEAGDLRYVGKHLSKKTNDLSDLKLRVRFLIAKGDLNEAIRRIKKHGHLAAGDPLLLAMKPFFRQIELTEYPPEFRDFLRFEPKAVDLVQASRDVPGIASLRMGNIAYHDVGNFVSDYTDYFIKGYLRFGAKVREPQIIDCGAEVGLSIIAIKRQYPNARIIAFEPDPDVLRMLQKNIETAGLGHVELHGEAVGEKDCEIVYNQQSSYARNLGLGMKSLKVRAARLSRFLQKPVSLLRLNLDGAELAVLKEAQEYLSNVDSIVVEYFSRDMSFHTLPLILRCLSDAGFQTRIQTLEGEAFQPLRHFWLAEERNGRLRIYGIR